MSPENSEDGNHPLIADSNQALVSAMNSQQPQASSSNFSSTIASLAQGMGVPLAAATTTAVPNGTTPFYGFTMEQLQSLGMVQQQPPAFVRPAPTGVVTADSSAAKRRRVMDGSASATQVPMMSTAGDDSSDGIDLSKGRKKSGAQVDRRRERNRILARRTRLRKKFFFESLQKEVVDLQRENLQLKDLVKTNLESEDSKKILDDCDAVEKLPPGVLEACAENGMSLDAQDFNLVQSIQSSQHSFIITDPSLEDNPIVFASDDFLKLTGYSREQVLGRNCRFLQGTDTSKETVEQIRKGLSVGEDVSVTLVNYTADGTPFWNKLFIAALRDAQNNIVNFIGVAVKVATPEPGHVEHGKFFEEFPTKEVAESMVDAMDDCVSAAMAAAGEQ